MALILVLIKTIRIGAVEQAVVLVIKIIPTSEFPAL